MLELGLACCLFGLFSEALAQGREVLGADCLLPLKHLVDRQYIGVLFSIQNETAFSWEGLEGEEHHHLFIPSIFQECMGV
jgi:hypothetical protein